ncbi:MAG: transcriptional regulator, LacI family [Actinotalea sp.]|nr:transcriptional regulator, LacI family [Actinotalea sp.]
MGRVTLQNVAHEVGVSRMAVSDAFSRADPFSADLRRTILAAADQLAPTGLAVALLPSSGSSTEPLAARRRLDADGLAERDRLHPARPTQHTRRTSP